jgi:glycosyltransferase involved in cell wall biosynthesis
VTSQRLEKPPVSVIIPCLDEAGTVGACVSRAREALAALGGGGEIIVADNGSSDDSAARAQAAGARVVAVPRRGYGNALRAGIAAARHPVAVVGDADGSCDFAEIPALVEPIANGEADLVIGNRRAGRARPAGASILAWLLNRLYGLAIHDGQCGFRAFRLDCIRALDLRAEGMEVGTEMLAKAARARLRIAEMPVRQGRAPRRRAPRLRRVRRSWRHARFLLLFGPLRLYLVPGLTGLALGVGLLAAGVFEPVVAGHRLSFHFSIVGGMLALLGAQIIGLGVYARAQAILQGGATGHEFARFIAHGKGRRQVAQSGAGLALIGISALVLVAVQWMRGHMGPLPADLSATAILGSTLVVLGFQLCFWSLLLEVLEVRGRATEPAAASTPEDGVSVIVVCRNERARIAACLDSLLCLASEPPHEILLVDGESTDGTREIILSRAAEHPRVRLISNPERSIAPGRNRGVAAARFAWVAFTDADCTVGPGWLAALVDGFVRFKPGEPALVAVGGGNRIPVERGFGHALAIARSTFWGHHGSVQGRRYRRATFVDHLPTVNVLYERAAIEEVGGFDESMGNIGEDVDLSQRLATRGKRFLYVPGCDVVHNMTTGAGDWAGKMVRYGMGRAWFVTTHGMRLKSVLLSVPAVFVVYLPLGLVAGFRWPWVWAPGALYLASTFVVSAIVCRRAGALRALPGVVAAYLLTHLAYGVGVLVGFVRPRRAATLAAAPGPALSEANRL